MSNGKRIVFFDLLRILSVAAIVLLHVFLTFDSDIMGSQIPIYGVFYPNIGIIGVYVLIFVSGSVLEYQYGRISSNDDILEFYARRLFRIYPAFWLSLAIGLVYAPSLVITGPFNLLLEIIGFRSYGYICLQWINPIGWFIGLLIVLYFLYPVLSASIRKYPYLMIFLLALVEITARYFLHSTWILGMSGDRWFPICNLLEFGLGIFIVQQGIYPKWTYDNRWLVFVAELSFYVFLVHDIFVKMVLISPAMYLVEVAVLSWLVMIGDERIQQALKKVL